jgi:methionyl-tRNA formyltransferase
VTELGVLVSGNLGFTILKELKDNYKVNFVLTDKQSLSILGFCIENQIPFFAGNPRGRDVINKLNDPGCDLIVSVNYLFLIEKDIIHYPRKIAVNFHGSLLPKYRGRTPHVWAIINNEKKTGITGHIIDENCDTGDIISQTEVLIKKEYTGQDVLNIFNQLYPGFVRETIDAIVNGKIKPVKQNNTKATYFGKRTAADGQISWEWQRERIYNWIRAQAKPYPGAFSFIGMKKIVIHRTAFSDAGFDYRTNNGQVIAFEDGSPVVKTPNGCIRLVEYEFPSPLVINDILK